MESAGAAGEGCSKVRQSRQASGSPTHRPATSGFPESGSSLCTSLYYLVRLNSVSLCNAGMSRAAFWLWCRDGKKGTVGWGQHPGGFRECPSSAASIRRTPGSCLWGLG